MRYQYAGPEPIEPDGEIIRPGDIREFDTEPGYGPWVCIDPPPEPEAPAPALSLAGPLTPKGM